MATTAQCIYCFETLAANLENRKSLTLREVEELWARYEDSSEQQDDGKNNSYGQNADDTLRPPSISRLQANSPGNSSSSSTTPSTTSSSSALDNASTTSSKTSLSAAGAKSPPETKEESHPVYVTWNTVSARGNKHLRGCIGTFSPMPLSEGLAEYSLVAALQDHRFRPITRRELPTLAAHITLLQHFEPCADALDWEVGKHGLRIHFNHKGRRYGATYLPDVAPEQGWGKEETVVSLMHKAGWNGKDSSDWKRVELECQRYQGLGADADYEDYRAWREWVGEEGLA